jgi:Na+/H+-dicarboxylate symporter
MLIFCESLSEVMFKFTNIVMYMAPLGVGARWPTLWDTPESASSAAC